MEIKTIVSKDTSQFDQQVNQALADGFNIVELGPRQTSASGWQMYAYLTKEVKTLPCGYDLIVSARQIYDECHSHRHCAGCPLCDICNAESPDYWHFDEDEE